MSDADARFQQFSEMMGRADELLRTNDPRARDFGRLVTRVLSAPELRPVAQLFLQVWIMGLSETDDLRRRIAVIEQALAERIVEGKP